MRMLRAIYYILRDLSQSFAFGRIFSPLEVVGYGFATVVSHGFGFVYGLLIFCAVVSMWIMLVNMLRWLCGRGEL